VKIITTHLHADFDCLASMVAARKLYPDAVLVFPGSQEKNVRDYLARAEFHVPYRKLKGLDLGSVRQMIVVDASTRDRIGAFATLADKEGVDVRLYDHHASQKIDIPHSLAVVRERGATVTVFVELLRERDIRITPAEATLMAIGLYEDTGSFTYTSVRSEDFEAGRWLFEQGADLNTVSTYVRHELSAPQVEMLNSLLQNLEYENIGGVMVALTTGSTPRYIGDLSALAHSLMAMENPGALFVLVRMADRIHLIARSRMEALDAGQVAERLGGGGHPSAASATIKNLTLHEAVGRLRDILGEALEPETRAREMMVERVISVSAADSISS